MVRVGRQLHLFFLCLLNFFYYYTADMYSVCEVPASIGATIPEYEPLFLSLLLIVFLSLSLSFSLTRGRGTSVDGAGRPERIALRRMKGREGTEDEEALLGRRSREEDIEDEGEISTLKWSCDRRWGRGGHYGD